MKDRAVVLTPDLERIEAVLPIGSGQRRQGHRLRPGRHARRGFGEPEGVIEIQRAEPKEDQVAEAQQPAIHVNVEDDFPEQAGLT